MYYIKNAPENASLPAIFENMRFALPLPLPLPTALVPTASKACRIEFDSNWAKKEFLGSAQVKLRVDQV
jgi:hypothetical protein